MTDPARPHYVCWRYERLLRDRAAALLREAVAIENAGAGAPGPETVAAIRALLGRFDRIEAFLDDAAGHDWFVPAFLRDSDITAWNAEVGC